MRRPADPAPGPQRPSVLRAGLAGLSHGRHPRRARLKARKTRTALMTNRTWLSRSVVGIGEAMVEFAPVDGNLYRRGFAGDTLNTCWHIAKIVGDRAQVGYLTRIGT